MNTAALPKLYQYAVCPFCWKVKAILDYKKIPYKAIEVHPLNKKEIAFSKDYRKVPIFVDLQGRQINDSTNIMQQIDAQYPERPVFEQEEISKTQENKWLKWADEILVRALPPLIYRNIPDAIKAFDYITKEGKFSWLQQRMVKYSGAVVMTMVAKKTAKAQGIVDAKKHLRNCLHDWNEALNGQDFLGGKKPNGADLAVYGILKSIESMPAFSIVEHETSVYEWFQRVESARA